MAWFMLAAVLLAFPLTYFGPLLLVATAERAAAGNPATHYLAFFSVYAIASFTGLLTAAIATAMRRTHWHKRFMYGAAITLVGPAISRWFLRFPPAAPWTDMGPNLLADVLFIPLVLHDRKTLGRVHPARIAILVTVPMHVLEPWIVSSDWWNALSLRLLGG
jgi:hypothetical protein